MPNRFMGDSEENRSETKVKVSKEHVETLEKKVKKLKKENKKLRERQKSAKAVSQATAEKENYESLRADYKRLQETHAALKQEHEALKKKLNAYREPPTLQETRAERTRAQEAEAASDALRKALNRKEATIERLQEKLSAGEYRSNSSDRVEEASHSSETASVVSKVSEVFVDWCRSERALIDRYYMFERELHESSPNTRVTPIYADENGTFWAGATDANDAFWLVETGVGPLMLPIPRRTGTFDALSPAYEGIGVAPEALAEITPARLSPRGLEYRLKMQGQLRRRTSTSVSDHSKSEKIKLSAQDKSGSTEGDNKSDSEDREASIEVSESVEQSADAEIPEEAEEKKAPTSKGVFTSEIVESKAENSLQSSEAEHKASRAQHGIQWANSPRAHLSDLLSSEKLAEADTLSIVVAEAINREQAFEDGSEAVAKMRASMEDWILSGNKEKEVARIATGRYLIVQKNAGEHMKDWASSLHRVSRKVPGVSLKGMHVAMTVASLGDDGYEVHERLMKALDRSRAENELITVH